MIKAVSSVIQPDLLVLDSREAILDLAPLLQGLANRCGHAGVSHWLKYLTDNAKTNRTVPYLVLILRPEEHQGRSLCVEDVEAAALLFECRIFGLRTGALTTADAMVISSVIAPAGRRMRMAAVAIRALLDRGAAIVVASYGDDSEANPSVMLRNWPGVLSAFRRRQVELGRTPASHVETAEAVTEILVRRKGLHAAALRWIAGFFSTPHGTRGRTSFLASALRDPGLEWIRGVKPPSPAHPLLGKRAAFREHGVRETALLN